MICPFKGFYVVVISVVMLEKKEITEALGFNENEDVLKSMEVL